MSGFRILGIDPGLARLGFGLIDLEENRLLPVHYGCLETPADWSTPRRLAFLYEELKKIIEQYQPSVMAVEQLFFYKNVTTAFVVGQARGVALLAGVQAGIEAVEYTPMQVKLAVTGYGKAVKTQVQDMVQLLLRLAERPEPDDTADALAIAITHAHASRKVVSRQSSENVKRPSIRYGRGVKP
ncbi:crossover junction endodeoxyribonuclease RuvC [Alicyclobacillus ferrooxydans]|uniref:Crossover junction endodeoxyribonuclease RuvC n=1 Tax=Alicyclobacillus ferrooxydans TaxID=471514 RepID=A0A0P9CGW0_9BACL|nr:crossover junction endodeoxyribonuclease RuvC [Alicyclobacillus ferrooxydans]KPV42267.1 Holliday junction resolvase [Alicyclobacillus ferrooxydans]